MAEQFIPVSALVVGDRIWMGGSDLWAKVTGVQVDNDSATFVRQRDFQVRVDREVPS